MNAVSLQWRIRSFLRREVELQTRALVAVSRWANAQDQAIIVVGP